MGREIAIGQVRTAARGYCLLMALGAAGGGAVSAQDLRQWMKSAARLIRFAFLLETEAIEYSPALAAVLAELLDAPRGG